MFLEVYVFNSWSVTIEQVFEDESLPEFPPREILQKQIEAEISAIKWLNEERGQIDNTDYSGQLILGNQKDNKVIISESMEVRIL